jgi:hypothetical protein
MTDNDIEIDMLTCEFVNKVEEALAAVTAAQKAVARLVSNQVYDIEMAEGPQGRDAIYELDAAARAAACRADRRLAPGTGAQFRPARGEPGR